MAWWMDFLPGIFVLTSLVACLLLLRRKGLARFSLLSSAANGGKRQIELLDRHGLSSQHTLYLVKVGHLKILLAGSPATCSLVAILPEADSGRHDIHVRQEVR